MQVSLFQCKNHHLNNSLLNEKSTMPLVEVPSPGQIVPREENVTDNSVPTVPKEPRRRSTRI